MAIGIDARLYNQTGVGRYIDNLLYCLSARDLKNKYVVFTNNQDIPYLQDKPNWKVVKINIPWHTVAEQTLFPLLLLRHQLNLVHFPYFSVPILYPGKYIITMHDLTNLNFTTGKASTLPYYLYQIKHLGYRLVLEVILRRAELIIAPSKTTAAEITKIKPKLANKIKVIYESGLLRTPAKEFPKMKEPYFLYVGNVYPHKNIEKAIFALNDINKKLTKQLKLIIVSKKDFFLARLRKFLDVNSLNNNIIIRSEVSDEELVQLYKQAIALILPSKSEGFGLPALEAMQLGCLLICSDIGIFHEICQEIPFFFNPYNVISVENAIMKIISLNDQDRHKRRLAGIQRAKDFSWQKMADETLALYEKLTQ